MRLAKFILQNREPILADCEAFARSIWPSSGAPTVELRDHLDEILKATVRDMNSNQSELQQSDKSKGDGEAEASSVALDGASVQHGVSRVESGLEQMAVVAEYRALRATVIRHWRNSNPNPDLHDIDDLTRFNESIDQSLTEAIHSYVERVTHSRQMFLAMLGHDLRNPLGSVALSAEMLALTSGDNHEQRELATQIAASTTAMGKLVTDLLDFASASLGGTMSLSPAAMDLKPLCTEVLAELRAANPMRLMFFQPKGDLTGEWDASRLRQVVSNLLGNAVQHGSAHGVIQISGTGDNEEVCLSFHNEGKPIPHTALATIFEPMVRGPSEPERQRKDGSIGLGLYIARAIVTAHGGTIDVTSSADAGTTFTVRLPRHQAKA